jgi:mono/diheme cytochrome c family protein
MKAFNFTLLIVTISLLAFACSKSSTETTTPNRPVASGSQAASTPDEFAATRAIFKKNCSECHGEDATGGTKTVDGKKLKIPNLRAGHALGHFDEDFIKQINKGGEGMPAFKDKLTPEQINELVHLIRHEFQGK